jgi:hypothetical protein
LALIRLALELERALEPRREPGFAAALWFELAPSFAAMFVLAGSDPVLAVLSVPVVLSVLAVEFVVALQPSDTAQTSTRRRELTSVCFVLADTFLFPASMQICIPPRCLSCTPVDSWRSYRIPLFEESCVEI